MARWNLRRASQMSRPWSLITLRWDLVVVVLLALVAQSQPPISRAQSERCQQVAARARPLTGDHAEAILAGPGQPDVWTIQGAVGTVTVRLSQLPADYDLFICGPDGQIVGISAQEGTADEEVTFTAPGPNDYLA